ncbi:transglycosylase [Sulfurimonas aquatica]|uniref:peptidoglycan lytic exotransglycosylase n=2 Tax=Sulfurimonas aquatica TaxID=2672570 RepID=A0A975B2K2_9BACT|nr:transglycosylase [Sulfurimonas aquatica]
MVSTSEINATLKPKILSKKLPKTYLIESSYDELPNFHNENYEEALKQFKNNCRTKKSKKLYGELCLLAENVNDSKEFITNSFKPYFITTKNAKEEGLLTGYYEPELRASLKKSKKYKYPIYTTPNDLITVDLSSIYPKLKNYRLRGKVEGNKLIPYDTRAQSKTKGIDAEVLCYCDSKIDRFFLEIQGSGRVKLEDNRTMYIGYDNQNGHRYRAIGRYLVQKNELRLKDVSLQSIKEWLVENPSRLDEVLNYNKSMVYFKQRDQAATGSLGLELTPERSVAVDRRYIPLGSMLYLNADLKEKKISKLVFAQDTGGAIKGSIRADLFLGAGEKALEVAGRLKAPLKLWILLPKDEKKSI